MLEIATDMGWISKTRKSVRIRYIYIHLYILETKDKDKERERKEREREGECSMCHIVARVSISARKNAVTQPFRIKPVTKMNMGE